MRELEVKEGCVYFFRHIGLTPVKIGFSTNASPIKRFEHLKTYAPYGAEILGFISSPLAKDLEKRLHNKYQAFRLEGEWFDLTEQQVNEIINHHQSIEQRHLKAEFELNWAKYIDQKNNSLKEVCYNDLEINEKKTNFFYVVKGSKNLKGLNISKLAREFDVSRVTIYSWINQYKTLSKKINTHLQ